MSFNRENMIWQSKDGSWNLGFYKVEMCGDYSDPDFDPEYDVEYDGSEFEWVSTGHATEDAACRSWDGANPGGHWKTEYSRHTAAKCKALDEMVWRYRNPEAAVKKDRRALRAKIKAVMTEENLTAGSYVKVTSSLNATIKHWQTGMVHQGTLTQEGNWLVVKDGSHTVKVLNTSTGTVHKDVSGIAKAERVTQRAYNRRYW